MPVLMPENYADLLVTTLKELGPARFQQVAQTLTHYEIFPRWFKRYKLQFSEGYSIQRTLMTSFANGAARMVGYTAEDQVNIGDYLTTMNIPWVHAAVSWGVIYQTDLLMNSGDALILNVLQPKRAAALIDLAELLETKIWGAAPAAANTVDPYSIQYWLVENATTGFNGGLPGDHTTIGGVNITTHDTFKNYTAQYTSKNKTDLIKKMRAAKRQTAFKSPVSVKDYRGSVNSDIYRIYMNETTISACEDIGEGQNENLGRDIASMDGKMLFHGNPMVYVPELDSRSDDPVYMIDHSVFYPVCLKGDYLRESPPRQLDSQHNAFQIHIDLSFNIACVDRRRCSVLSTG